MSTYTEEEAAEKWCPFARVVESSKAGSSNARNRVVLIDADPPTKLSSELIGAHCIASACMAWRAVTINELSEVVFAGTREGKRGTGYCGLAGRLK